MARSPKKKRKRPSKNKPPAKKHRSAKKVRPKRQARKPARETPQQAAMRSLIERLGGESQAQEFLAQQEKLREQRQKRISELEDDKIFVPQTEQLKRQLEDAFRFNPGATESFFSHFPIPGPHNFRAALQFVDSLPSHVQDALRAYIRYASTYGVYLVRRKGLFEWKVAPSSLARKFLANLVDGRLEPAVAMPAGDASDFEVPGVPVWPDVQDLLDESQTEQSEDEKERVKIKFIEIQDRTGNSVLNDV
jgi:hypothetical protein